MAERRHRDRVDQLRIEAGVPLSPESIEVRHARLKDMQMESLGTRRRDSISTQDYRANRAPAASMRSIEASRLSNRPGTEEFRISNEHQGALSSWNNAYIKLDGDGTLEEELQDINSGQTHRIRLIGDQSVRHHNDGTFQDGSRRGSGLRGDIPHGTDSLRGNDHAYPTDGPREADRPQGNSCNWGTARAWATGHTHEAVRFRGTDSPHETNHPRGFHRPRGGREGRGGGHAGGQNRGSRTERIPTGYSGNSSQMSSAQQEYSASIAPHTSGKDSLTADPNRSSQPGPSNSESSQQAAPTQSVLAAAAPATNWPIPQKWDQQLASPEEFVAVMRRGEPAPISQDQRANAAFAEARQRTVTPDATMASEEVDREVPGPSKKGFEPPSPRNSAGDYTDTLISTSVEIEPKSIHSRTLFPLTAEEKDSSFSYSRDLVGLEFGTSGGSSTVARDAGGNKFEDSETPSSNPTLDPGSSLSAVIAHLLPILAAMRQQLNPDSMVQLDEILAQLEGKLQQPSSSAATHDTKQVVPDVQPLTDNTAQALPNVKVDEAIVSASNETKLPVPTEQQTTSRGVQDLLLDRLEPRISMAAISSAGTILNQSEAPNTELKGKKEEIFSRQASFGRNAGQKDFHCSPSKKGGEDMIIGTHLMPGQSHRQEITRSNSGASSLDRPTPPLTVVTDRNAQSTLDRLTSQLNELYLGRTADNKGVQKLTTVNPFGSTLGQFSAIRRESSWYGGDPIVTQHGPPARGSRPNSSWFFGPGIQSSPLVSQPAPASPVRPVASSPAQGQREQVTPATYVATSQNLGSVPTGPSKIPTGPKIPTEPSKMNSSRFFHPRNQSPGPSSRPAPTAQPVSARSTASQSHLAGVTPSVITNRPTAERSSVFKTTFVPTEPSQFNRTGLFREENQLPFTKKFEK